MLLRIAEVSRHDVLAPGNQEAETSEEQTVQLSRLDQK
jgi:hypothetical protein